MFPQSLLPFFHPALPRPDSHPASDGAFCLTAHNRSATPARSAPSQPRALQHPPPAAHPATSQHLLPSAPPRPAHNGLTRHPQFLAALQRRRPCREQRLRRAAPGGTGAAAASVLCRCVRPGGSAAFLPFRAPPDAVQPFCYISVLFFPAGAWKLAMF